MVVFGAAGDLARRLLVPSLYNLCRDRLLDRRFAILGVDHNALDDASFRQLHTASIEGLAADKTSGVGGGKLSPVIWRRLSQRLSFHQGDFEDPALYQALARRLANERNVLFYLATAPRFFADIVEQLGGPACCARPAAGGAW
jgi:glucose-6-phosphate 1-dehydrogenase